MLKQQYLERRVLKAAERWWLADGNTEHIELRAAIGRMVVAREAAAPKAAGQLADKEARRSKELDAWREGRAKAKAEYRHSGLCAKILWPGSDVLCRLPHRHDGACSQNGG